ncbi:MAG TPA: ABC transporter ATP-binding protein [Baekduia sp.]|uniref:ABC transporter ATP-binding protein n=1 Tax=Baekduia sp. TaxID=2600305 RepID=UPI002D02AB20|nr:ABC transporter ATP-binding protein [Baekduia sp.]HMJ34747.1 ABC transporter ATP-binding protein [Baekduia sp.]
MTSTPDLTTTGSTVLLDGVVKRYVLDEGTELVAADGVSLAVEAGGLVALTGPSGSGKSTLLHLVGGVDGADAGTITVDDRKVTALRGDALAAHRRHVGFVFQRFNLLGALTARDNVLAPVVPFKVPFDKAARAGELLAAVGLAGREGSLPSRMSGGQQQRVAIARALIWSPGLLLADEPTGNLDSRTGADILDLLLALRSERGTTILLATHDPVVAARCDRLVRLQDGRITDDVDLRPGDVDVAALLAGGGS